LFFAGGNAADESSDHATLPRRDAIRRLRERGEPIMLFGETELDAFRRLRRNEILEPEVNKVITLVRPRY
jgi:pre-mRNA-splicing factor 18